MTTLIRLSSYLIVLESKNGAENGPGYSDFYIELLPESRQLYDNFPETILGRLVLLALILTP